MPSIELEFHTKKFSKKMNFFFYSINIQDFPKLNEIDGENIALNNYNIIFEDEIPKNPLFHKLTFEILHNEELKIKPLILEDKFYNRDKRKYEKIKWKIKLYILHSEEYFSIYLKIKKYDELIAEYLNIKTVNSNKKKSKINDKNIKIENIENFQLTKNEVKQNNSKIEKREKKNDRLESLSIDSNKLIQKDLKKKLLESKVGLENPSSTCNMASLLQAFIHSDIFLQKFFDNYNSIGKFSQILYNLFIKISMAKENSSIPLKDFAYSLNQIDKKYNPQRGNNPILFITDLLEHLDQENKNSIKSVFLGVKSIKLKKYRDYDSDEEFLIYLISIDENKKSNSFYELLKNKTLIEIGNEIDSMEESIIKVSSILIINIDNLVQRGIKFEHRINICNKEFDLYAINSYTDYHSKM